MFDKVTQTSDFNTYGSRICGLSVVNAVICPDVILASGKRLLCMDAPQRTSQVISQPIPQVTRKMWKG